MPLEYLAVAETLVEKAGLVPKIINFVDKKLLFFPSYNKWRVRKKENYFINMYKFIYHSPKVNYDKITVYRLTNYLETAKLKFSKENIAAIVFQKNLEIILNCYKTLNMHDTYTLGEIYRGYKGTMYAIQDGEQVWPINRKKIENSDEFKKQTDRLLGSNNDLQISLAFAIKAESENMKNKAKFLRKINDWLDKPITKD